MKLSPEVKSNLNCLYSAIHALGLDPDLYVIKEIACLYIKMRLQKFSINSYLVNDTKFFEGLPEDVQEGVTGVLRNINSRAPLYIDWLKTYSEEYCLPIGNMLIKAWEAIQGVCEGYNNARAILYTCVFANTYLRRKPLWYDLLKVHRFQIDEIRALESFNSKAYLLSPERKQQLNFMLDQAQRGKPGFLWNISTFSGISGEMVHIKPTTRKDYPLAELLEKTVALWMLEVGLNQTKACEAVEFLFSHILPKKKPEWDVEGIKIQVTPSRAIGIKKYLEDGGYTRWKESHNQWLSSFDSPLFLPASQKVCYELKEALK